MSLNRRIAWGVSASYASRAAQIVLNLSLIPLLFSHLSAEEVGIWFLISQSSMFIGLLDFGFGPTLTRRIAFAKGMSGGDVDVDLTNESRNRIAQLSGTGRILYRYLAVLIFFVAGGTGAFFLSKIESASVNHSEILAAWGLICVSYAINTWAGFWGCLLGGLGYVGSIGFLGLAFQIGGLLAKIAVVLLGGGLLQLAIVECVIGLASRQSMMYVVHRRHPEFKQLVGRWHKDTFQSLLRPSILCWLTSLGTFLILRTDQYFIAFYKGADELPNYQAAYSVIGNLHILAISLSMTSMTFYSQLWHSRDLSILRDLQRRNLLIGMAIMICGTGAIVFASPALFDVWLGPGHFIGYPIIAIFSLTLTLDLHHAIFSTATRATENEAFVISTLAAGLLNFVLTWVLIGPLGLFGVALGTCLAQVLTNNWYCVYRGCQRLSLNVRQYIRDAYRPLGMLATKVYLPPLYLIQANLWPKDARLQLALCCAWSGGLLAIFTWKHILPARNKTSIVTRILQILTPA